MNELPHGQAIHITFDPDEARWLLMLHKVKTYYPDDIPDELRYQFEVPVDLPEDVGLIANELATADFDSLNDLQSWLHDNLDKLWGWMTGYEQVLPSDLSMP